MEVQKKNSNEITFDFQEESFIYKMRDGSGTQTLVIDYLGVDIATIDEFIERNEWFRNVWFFWIILSIYYVIATQKGSIWFIMGIGMLVIYYRRTTYYSSLKSDNGKFFIIKDKKHNSILEKICSEKRKLLREKYFFFDPDNSPEKEILKYQYLKDDGAITEEEFVNASNLLLEKSGIIKNPN